jgi:hypothetical protein
MIIAAGSSSRRTAQRGRRRHGAQHAGAGTDAAGGQLAKAITDTVPGAG